MTTTYIFTINDGPEQSIKVAPGTHASFAAAAAVIVNGAIPRTDTPTSVVIWQGDSQPNRYRVDFPRQQHAHVLVYDEDQLEQSRRHLRAMR